MQYDSDKNDEDKTPIWTTGRKLEKTHTHREGMEKEKKKRGREIEWGGDWEIEIEWEPANER